MRNHAKYPLTADEASSDLSRVKEEVSKDIVPGDTKLHTLNQVAAFIKKNQKDFNMFCACPYEAAR